MKIQSSLFPNVHQSFLRFSQWNTKVVLFVNFECSKQVIQTIVMVFVGVFFSQFDRCGLLLIYSLKTSCDYISCHCNLISFYLTVWFPLHPYTVQTACSLQGRGTMRFYMSLYLSIVTLYLKMCPYISKFVKISQCAFVCHNAVFFNLKV